MLRNLLNEPKRVDAGELLHAFQAMEQFRQALSGRKKQLADGDLSAVRLDLWAQGFTDALNELEESKYCAEFFAGSVHSSYVEEMGEEEQDQYRRHLYFYKNAFIRVFSVLDKLGYFLNDLYQLGTEKIKSRFSYFTVLRHMHEKQIEAELEQKLFDLKVSYRDPLRRLREQRNMEIHLLNAEMVDDMMRAKHARWSEDRQKVENLKGNLSDLSASYEMVCRAVETIFVHAKRSMGQGNINK